MARSEKPEVFIALLYAPQRFGPQIWTTNKIFVLKIHHTTQHTHTHTHTHTFMELYLYNSKIQNSKGISMGCYSILVGSV